MEIKALALSEQMRMIRGVDNIVPENKNGVSAPEGGNTVSFTDFLKAHYDKANDLGVESERAIERSVKGEELNPHTTLLALQRAEISFQLLMSVKQRIEQAYQEIIRTPLG